MADPRSRRQRMSLRRIVTTVPIAALLAAGCAGTTPDRWNFAVVHVASDDCTPQESAMIVSADGVEWARMHNTRLCGPASERGGVIQVWKSDSLFKAGSTVQVRLGRSDHDTRSWIVAAGDSLRIDHSHILLGTLDTRTSTPAFVVAADLGTAADPLEERQSCHREGWSGGCGTDWEHADLLTFEPAP